MSDKREKNPNAVALGRLGAKARQEKLTPERRREIAQKAIRARWAKARKKKSFTLIERAKTKEHAGQERRGVFHPHQFPPGGPKPGRKPKQKEPGRENLNSAKSLPKIDHL